MGVIRIFSGAPKEKLSQTAKSPNYPQFGDSHFMHSLLSSLLNPHQAIPPLSDCYARVVTETHTCRSAESCLYPRDPDGRRLWQHPYHLQSIVRLGCAAGCESGLRAHLLYETVFRKVQSIFFIGSVPRPVVMMRLFCCQPHPTFSRASF